MKRDEFIAKARSYIGTPFHHQGRLPGVGLDCVGVVVCAARELGYEVHDQVGYAKIPRGRTLIQAVEEHCDRIELATLQPGDLMLFSFIRDPQHLVIVTEVYPVINVVHSWSDSGKTVENSMDEQWWRRLVGCYQLKGIE